MAPLLCAVWPSMGAGGRDYRAFSLEAERVCGGFGVGMRTLTDPHDTRKVRHGLMVSTHCLDRNVKQTVELLGDLLLESRLGMGGEAGGGEAGGAIRRLALSDVERASDLSHLQSILSSYQVRKLLLVYHIQCIPWERHLYTELPMVKNTKPFTYSSKTLTLCLCNRTVSVRRWGTRRIPWPCPGPPPRSVRRHSQTKFSAASLTLTQCRN